MSSRTKEYYGILRKSDVICMFRHENVYSILINWKQKSQIYNIFSIFATNTHVLYKCKKKSEEALNSGKWD